MYQQRGQQGNCKPIFCERVPGSEDEEPMAWEFPCARIKQSLQNEPVSPGGQCACTTGRYILWPAIFNGT